MLAATAQTARRYHTEYEGYARRDAHAELIMRVVAGQISGPTPRHAQLADLRKLGFEVLNPDLHGAHRKAGRMHVCRRASRVLGGRSVGQCVGGPRRRSAPRNETATGKLAGLLRSEELALRKSLATDEDWFAWGFFVPCSRYTDEDSRCPSTNVRPASLTMRPRRSGLKDLKAKLSELC
jgi:hypothetical protein